MERPLSSLLPELLDYLTIEDEAQIHQHFQGKTWKPNSQVLWSGVLPEEAQKWADDREMQTLTTAMGPLMDPEHPSCLRKKKSAKQWKMYIKGASAVFAWCISRGDRVTVLTPPPPERFHPSGLTNFQAIEAPILKWSMARNAHLRIEMVHPNVKGAEDLYYQTWPIDETETWLATFRTAAFKKHSWRPTTKNQKQLVVREVTEVDQVLDRADIPAAIGRDKVRIYA
ncbi:hypothetical protein PMIN03_012681 [Paraphaeosphaeria minitans]